MGYAVFTKLNKKDQEQEQANRKTMSDPSSPYIKTRDGPSWGLYQRENFWKLNDGQVPPFNTREYIT